MAKRFTDTGLYDKEWFQELELKHKVFWEFITKKCDHAGIWDVNVRMASYIIGAEFKKEELLEVFKDRIIPIDNDKWFIKKFIVFQYGNELNDLNRVHKSVISRLIKVLPSPIDRANEDLSRTIARVEKVLRIKINTRLNTKLNKNIKEKLSKKKNGVPENDQTALTAQTALTTLYKWFVGEDNLIGQSPTPVQRTLLNAALGHIALENWKPYIDNMHDQVENYGRQMPEMKFFFEGSYLRYKTVKEIE